MASFVIASYTIILQPSNGKQISVPETRPWLIQASSLVAETKIPPSAETKGHIFLYEKLPLKIDNLGEKVEIGVANKLYDSPWDRRLLFVNDKMPGRLWIETCASLKKAKIEDWYALDTASMMAEQYFDGICSVLSSFKIATPIKTDNFGKFSPNWMNFLPISVLPMPGGIYNNQTWESAKRKHIELTKNKKLLGEVLDNIQISKRKISSRILGTSRLGERKTSKNNLGRTRIHRRTKCWDVLDIEPLARGDFTGDGLADVILKVRRFENAGRLCGGGSGAALGSTSRILISRTRKNGIAKSENIN